MNPYIRAVYLSLTETPHHIEGHVHSIAYENEHSEPADDRIELTFYRPGSGLKTNEWLKDMLVQIIEQL